MLFYEPRSDTEKEKACERETSVLLVKFLHSAGITHGDLTPRHIGVTAQSLVKLLGFDNANAGVAATPDQQTQSAIYGPPEFSVQDWKCRKSEKGVASRFKSICLYIYTVEPQWIVKWPFLVVADIWATGCIIYEMSKKEPLFNIPMELFGRVHAIVLPDIQSLLGTLNVSCSCFPFVELLYFWEDVGRV